MLDLLGFSKTSICSAVLVITTCSHATTSDKPVVSSTAIGECQTHKGGRMGPLPGCLFNKSTIHLLAPLRAICCPHPILALRLAHDQGYRVPPPVLATLCRFLCRRTRQRYCASDLCLLLWPVTHHRLSSFFPTPFLLYIIHLQVQTAVDHRTVDSKLLVTAISGTFVSSIVLRFLHYARKQITRPLHLRIKLFYSVHIFHAMVRLDVPTFDDPAIQHQFAQAFPKHSHTTIAFSAVTLTIRLISTALQLVSHVFVLARVLRNQPDGPLLAVLYFSYSILQWSNTRNSYTTKGGMYSLLPTIHLSFNIFQSGPPPPVMKITLDRKVSSSQSTIPYIARRLSPLELPHFSLLVRPL